MGKSSIGVMAGRLEENWKEMDYSIHGRFFKANNPVMAFLISNN